MIFDVHICAASRADGSGAGAAADCAKNYKRKVKKMGKIKIDDAFASESADRFTGIDRTGVFGNLKQAFELTNFRIREDGSLEKRCGYLTLAELPSDIDAVIVGSLEGEERVLALAGGNVYCIDSTSGEFTLTGQVSDTRGGCFFMLGAALYTIAGGQVYICESDTVYAADGYVPLYGSEWTQTGGEINEPINLLSPHVRISYLLTEEASSLYTGLNVASVELLSINNQATGGIRAEGKFIRLPAAYPAGTKIEVCLTMTTDSEPPEREELVSCTDTYVGGSGRGAVAYCFGGSNASKVFRTKYVSATAYARSLAAYPASGRLYFPAGYSLEVDIPGGVRSICGVGSQLLLCGADQTRLVSFEGDGEVSEESVFNAIGCTSPNSVARAGKSIYTCGENGVCRWTLPQGAAEVISTPPDELADSEFLSRAVAVCQERNGELLISDPEDNDGRVLVYNYKCNAWYTYDDIGASRFFEVHGSTGFVCGNGLYLFDENAMTDLGCGGEREISAVYVSRYTDMSRPAQDKRLRRVFVCSSGGDLTLTLYDAVGGICSRTLTDDLTREIALHECVVSSGRFEFVRCRLDAGGTARQRIYGITLTAIK